MLISPEKNAGRVAKVKETAAPNQIAAFMMPMNRMTRITASRYEKRTARAKRETRIERIADCGFGTEETEESVTCFRSSDWVIRNRQSAIGNPESRQSNAVG